MAVTEENINFLINAAKLKNSENELQRIPIEAEDKFVGKIRQGLYKEIHLKPFSKLRELYQP